MRSPTRWPWYAVVSAPLLMPGCEAQEATQEEDLTAKSYTFVDVNPDAPLSAKSKKTILAALAKIDRVAKHSKSEFRSELARETLARIEAGDVKLGSIAGARGVDRWHMCMDYAQPACADTNPPAQDDAWLGDDALGAFLERELDGYQWGNRLYFTVKPSTDVDALAATLIHEVNHVLNRSECSYYVDTSTHEVDGNRAFVEEYRAFLAECFFERDTSASASVCGEYAFEQVSTYGFDFDLQHILPSGATDPLELAELVLEEDLAGLMIPREDTLPTSFGTCPTH